MFLNRDRLPSTPPAVIEQANAYLEGAEPDQWRVNARRHAFWSRVDLDDVVAGESIQFFSDNVSRYVTNWNPSGLASGQLFIIEGFRVTVTGGYNVDGTADAASDPYDADGLVSLATAGDLAQLLNNGVVNFAINDRQIIDGVYGLRNFPTGGGPNVAMHSTDADTTSGAQTSAAIVNNGHPSNSNVWLCSPRQILSSNESIDCDIVYPFARTLSGDVVIEFAIHGMYFTPAQR